MAATQVDRLQRALAHADFPADKADLVRYAEQANADTDTVRALKAIPPDTYSNFTEVLRSVPLQDEGSPAEKAARRRTHTKPGLSERDKDIPVHPIVEEIGENRKS
jgi:hypothetical protein